MANDLLILGVGLTILATLVGSGGALFLKFLSTEKTISNLIKNKFLYLGLFLYGTSAIIFIIALQFGELSILYPVSALSYIWISLLSIKFLKEKMNDYKWFGVVLIVTGVILISLGA